MKRLRLDLVRSEALRDMPKAVQELAKYGLHVSGWGLSIATPEELDARYEQLEEMLQAVVDMAGEEKLTGPKGDPRVWLLALATMVHQNQDELAKKWPSLSFVYGGKVEQRTLTERIFASVALWRLSLAIAAVRDGDFQTSIAEVAVAGISLAYSGSFGASELAELNESVPRRKGAFSRWSGTPEEAARCAARELWPEAIRKGWTATRFHTELAEQGHAVAPDTARKWVTKLRKTGTC